MQRWQTAERDAARTDLTAEWLSDSPGSVLPVSGMVLRDDGEAWSNWWRRQLRADPCSYCGGQGGTVDHVVPQRTGRPGVHRWPNLVGACQPCNESKSDRPLLLWLLRRR